MPSSFSFAFGCPHGALTSLGANSGPLLDAPSQTGITLNKSTSVEKPSYLNLKPSGGKLSAFLAVSFAPFLSFLVAFFDAIVFLLCFWLSPWGAHVLRCKFGAIAGRAQPNGNHAE